MANEETPEKPKKSNPWIRGADGGPRLIGALLIIGLFGLLLGAAPAGNGVDWTGALISAGLAAGASLLLGRAARFRARSVEALLTALGAFLIGVWVLLALIPAYPGLRATRWPSVVAAVSIGIGGGLFSRWAAGRADPRSARRGRSDDAAAGG